MVRKSALLLVVPLLLTAAGGCLEGGDDGGGALAAACPTDLAAVPAPDAAGPLTATLNTSMGDVVVELFRDEAPVTVANFVRYAHEGFYGGTIFHRVIENFVVQGGGFTPAMTKKDTHDPIPLDVHPDLKNERGTLSMARTQNPHSATSQFYVNLKHNTNLDGGYAVFAEVTEGMDVVDRMAQVNTTSRGQYSDVPAEDIVLNGVTVHLPDESPHIGLAPYLGEYAMDAERGEGVPFLLTNGWDAPRTVTLAAGNGTAAVQSPMGEGGVVELPPGGSALVIATPEEGSGAAVVRATSGDLVAEACSGVAAPGGGDAVGADENNKVDVRYVGFLDTGVPFDTNVGELEGRDDLRLAYGQGGRTDTLPVWTGDGQSPSQEYINVIPGFRDALLGLHEGESALVHVPPSQGYKDGVDRWFLVEVVGVSS